MQTIKAVIFDLDGTLADTIPLCIEAFRKTVEPRVQRSLSNEEIKASFGPDEEGSIKALAPHNYENGVADFLKYYTELHHICPQPFDGIKELLEMLKEKKISLSLVTGKGKESTHISLRHFNLFSYFDAIETGSPKGSRKPEAIAHLLSSFQNINKEEVIYVGDSAGDIKDSRKAGVFVVAAAWAGTVDVEKLEAEKPDELFYSIPDFRDWIVQHI